MRTLFLWHYSPGEVVESPLQEVPVGRSTREAAEQRSCRLGCRCAFFFQEKPFAQDVRSRFESLLVQLYEWCMRTDGTARVQESAKVILNCFLLARYYL